MIPRLDGAMNGSSSLNRALDCVFLPSFLFFVTFFKHTILYIMINLGSLLHTFPFTGPFCCKFVVILLIIMVDFTTI